MNINIFNNQILMAHSFDLRKHTDKIQDITSIISYAYIKFKQSTVKHKN